MGTILVDITANANTSTEFNPSQCNFWQIPEFNFSSPQNDS